MSPCCQAVRILYGNLQYRYEYSYDQQQGERRAEGTPLVPWYSYEYCTTTSQGVSSALPNLVRMYRK